MMRISFFFVTVFLLAVVGCGPDQQHVTGQAIFTNYCSTCHQSDGSGVPGAFPPLVESEWAQGDKGRLIRLVLRGMQGPIVVQGEEYNNVMTPHDFLTDTQVAAVLTYVRHSFGNDAEPVDSIEVARVRAVTPTDGLWYSRDLERALGIPEPDSLATPGDDQGRDQGG